ncbi:MAG: permease of phosphate ABC transporter [Enterocloster asparagiformis]|nr:permease of phosphate ABC transporter [Enterocloster asparagiformis]
MKKFFDYANQYIRESDWKVIAALKLCLLSLGICLGLSLPGEKKKPVFALAAAVFIATYIPLMAKFVKILCGSMDER